MLTNKQYKALNWFEKPCFGLHNKL